MSQYDVLNCNKFSVHQKIVKLVGNGKKVLDVGCSVGTISAVMKTNGCEVFGIELDESSAIEASKHCVEVFRGDVESIKLDEKYEKYFDVIIFADILEHLKDPSRALRRFKCYLKEDGIVIISLPNIANWRIRLNLLFGNFDYKDHGLLDRGHLRFFTLKNSKNLIKISGYEIISFDSTVGDLNRFANIFYRLGRLWPGFLAYQFLIVAQSVN
jgi:methionine biosynthesis protein MetW